MPRHAKSVLFCRGHDLMYSRHDRPDRFPDAASPWQDARRPRSSNTIRHFVDDDSAFDSTAHQQAGRQRRLFADDARISPIAARQMLLLAVKYRRI